MPVLREIEGMAVPGYFTVDGGAGLLGVPLSSSSYFWNHPEEKRTQAKPVRKHARGIGISVSAPRGRVDMAPGLV